MKTGMTAEVILACLLHDTVHALIKVDHGYWGAQLYGPYVPEKIAFAIRYHQALRFYEDRKPATSIPTCTGICSVKTMSRHLTSRPITRCSKATSGTWNRDWLR